MPSKQTDKPTKGKCQIPKKYTDIGILFSSITLALCLQYLFPSIRFGINNVWPTPTKSLCERLKYIWTQFLFVPNKWAIIVAIVVGIVAVVAIFLLIFRRRDRDDEVVDKLEEISKNTSAISDIAKALGVKGSDNHAQKETGAKSQTNKRQTDKVEKKGGKA